MKKLLHFHGSIKKLFAIIHIFKSYNSSLICERGVYIHYMQSLILFWNNPSLNDKSRRRIICIMDWIFLWSLRRGYAEFIMLMHLVDHFHCLVMKILEEWFTCTDPWKLVQEAPWRILWCNNLIKCEILLKRILAFMDRWWIHFLRNPSSLIADRIIVWIRRQMSQKRWKKAGNQERHWAFHTVRLQEVLQINLKLK